MAIAITAVKMGDYDDDDNVPILVYEMHFSGYSGFWVCVNDS